MKKKKIILIVFIILVISAAVVLYLSYDEKKIEPTADDTPIVVDNFTGIYNNNSVTLYLYEINNHVYYSTEDGAVNGNFANNKQKSTFVDNLNFEYTFTLKENGLQIDSNNTNLPSDFYKKIDECTPEKYFEIMFFKPEFFNSKYNGYYKNINGKSVVYMFQEDSNNVILQFISDNQILRRYFLINNDNLSVTSDNGVTSNITFNGDEMIYTSTNNIESNSNVLLGTYKKIKNITYEDVITDRIKEFEL